MQYGILHNIVQVVHYGIFIYIYIYIKGCIKLM